MLIKVFVILVQTQPELLAFSTPRMRHKQQRSLSRSWRQLRMITRLVPTTIGLKYIY